MLRRDLFHMKIPSMRQQDDLCLPKPMRNLRKAVGFFVLVAVGAAAQLFWLSRVPSSSPFVEDIIIGEDGPERLMEPLKGEDDSRHGNRPRPSTRQVAAAIHVPFGDNGASRVEEGGGGRGRSPAKGTAAVANASSSPAAGATNNLRAGRRPQQQRTQQKRKHSLSTGRGSVRKGLKDLILSRAKKWVAADRAAKEAAGLPPDEFPEETVLGRFETKAAKEEARRHDRLIVEGMAHVASLTEEDLAEWDMPHVRPSTLCINILTSNRKIPYVNALIMMLMRGQSPQRLLVYAKVNLLNIERRPERMEYSLMRDRLSRLPFVSVRNITRDYPAGPDVPFHKTQRTNTIAAFDLCIESNLPFCLLMEDDAVTPMNFIDSFDTFVRPEMEKPDFTASSVSLHSYHSFFASRSQVDLMDEYHKPNGTYEHEVSKTNARLRHLGMSPYVPYFELVNTTQTFGTVANVYTLKMAEKYRDFLVKFDDETNSAFPDVLMFNPRYYGGYGAGLLGRRMQVEPSMVNHIGFYSEINKEKSFKASDVRFQLDAGRLD